MEKNSWGGGGVGYCNNTSSSGLDLLPWNYRDQWVASPLKISHGANLTTGSSYSEKEALSTNAKMLELIWRQNLTWTDVRLFIASVWIFMCFAAELEMRLIMEYWPGLSWEHYIMLGIFCGSFFFSKTRKSLNSQTYLTQIGSDQFWGTSIVCKTPKMLGGDLA